jgi:hypothetical protein
MNKPERDFRKAILTAPMRAEEIDAIQAVEGLHLSPRMKALFEQAERENWTHQERRTRILETLGVTLD